MEQSTGIKGERKLIALKLHMLNVVGFGIQFNETVKTIEHQNQKQTKIKHSSSNLNHKTCELKISC